MDPTAGLFVFPLMLLYTATSLHVFMGKVDPASAPIVFASLSTPNVCLSTTKVCKPLG
jgi:hypothetical protein